MNIGLKRTGGGSGDVGLVTLTAGMDTQVALQVDHPAAIKSLTLVSHGPMTLDLEYLTSLKTFVEDNGGGGYLLAFPHFPASIEFIQIHGSGYYFSSVDASALTNLTHLDCSQIGQIGVNGGAITLPSGNKLTFVSFGACNLGQPAVDALLASVVNYAAGTCAVYVDGPGNYEPTPGDRSTTGAILGADWVMTPDGTLGRYWVLAGDTTYYLCLHPTGVWVIASSLTPDLSSDPYWSGPASPGHSIGNYTAQNGAAGGDIAVGFNAPCGVQSILTIVGTGGAVTYNNMGNLPW